MKKRIAALFLAATAVISMSAQASAVSVKNMGTVKGIKNIIVMVPDGMSAGGVSLSRWYKAYDKKTNKLDLGVSLALDELTSGSVRTYWSNGKSFGPITDSAPAGTAMATGNKTNDKHISVTPGEDKKPLATVLEGAKTLGKSTGVVATSNIQHATPAGFSSHYFDRSRYDILSEQQVYQGIDVMLGSGYKYLTAPYRKDGENMIEEIRALDYQYITTRKEMNSVTKGKVFGMFGEDALAYEMDRTALNKTKGSDEPSLAEMTDKAIDLLSQNEKGFFLMVEGSKVDWAAHANDPIGIISDILAFDDAVKVALDFAKADGETMILVASDHGNGGITIGDAATSSTYSSDLVRKFIKPLSKATLTGEGVAMMLNEKRTNIDSVMKKYYGISDLTDEERAAIKEAPASAMNYVVGPMISKRANIGWTTNGHTGEDPALFTYLPEDNRLTGTINNTDFAKVCEKVWGINLKKLTKEIFINANEAFTAKGATVTVDKSNPDNPKLVVKKGDKTIEIPESKNYVLVNGKKTTFDSVTVQTLDNFYVSSKVIDLIG